MMCVWRMCLRIDLLEVTNSASQNADLAERPEYSLSSYKRFSSNIFSCTLLLFELFHCLLCGITTFMDRNGQKDI